MRTSRRSAADRFRRGLLPSPLVKGWVCVRVRCVRFLGIWRKPPEIDCYQEVLGLRHSNAPYTDGVNLPMLNGFTPLLSLSAMWRKP